MAQGAQANNDTGVSQKPSMAPTSMNPIPTMKPWP